MLGTVASAVRTMKVFASNRPQSFAAGLKRAVQREPIIQKGNGSHCASSSSASLVTSSRSRGHALSSNHARLARAYATSDEGVGVEGLGKSPLYVALEDCEVFRVSDESKVKLTEMWKQDERAVVAFARHFG